MRGNGVAPARVAAAPPIAASGIADDVPGEPTRARFVLRTGIILDAFSWNAVFLFLADASLLAVMAFVIEPVGMLGAAETGDRDGRTKVALKRVHPVR